jgi:hypothetical protein
MRGGRACGRRGAWRDRRMKKRGSGKRPNPNLLFPAWGWAAPVAVCDHLNCPLSLSLSVYKLKQTHTTPRREQGMRARPKTRPKTRRRPSLNPPSLHSIFPFLSTRPTQKSALLRNTSSNTPASAPPAAAKRASDQMSTATRSSARMASRASEPKDEEAGGPCLPLPFPLSRGAGGTPARAAAWRAARESRGRMGDRGRAPAAGSTGGRAVDGEKEGEGGAGREERRRTNSHARHTRPLPTFAHVLPGGVPVPGTGLLARWAGGGGGAARERGACAAGAAGWGACSGAGAAATPSRHQGGHAVMRREARGECWRCLAGGGRERRRSSV